MKEWSSVLKTNLPDFLEDFLQGCGLTFDMNKGPFLAGGAVRRAMQWPKYQRDTILPPDYDVFCANRGQFEQVCDTLLRVGAELVVENDTYANFFIEERGWKIQVIKRKFYPNAEALLDDFDFTICQFAIDSFRYVMAPDNAYPCLKAGKLVVNKITEPLSSFVRLMKYSKQGFKIDGEDLVEFMEQCKIKLGANAEGEWESYIHSHSSKGTP